MKPSKFNIKEKLLRSIMNYLFPKLTNICEIFDLQEIIVSEKVNVPHGNLINSQQNKFTFSIKTNKSSGFKDSFITYSVGLYYSARTNSISDFEKDNDLSFETLVLISKLFMEIINTYSKKEDDVNKIIDDLNKLEIIYRKEFLLEKIKRIAPKPKKTRAARARQPQLNNDDDIEVFNDYIFEGDDFNGLHDISEMTTPEELIRMATIIQGGTPSNMINSNYISHLLRR